MMADAAQVLDRQLVHGRIKGGARAQSRPRHSLIAVNVTLDLLAGHGLPAGQFKLNRRRHMFAEAKAVVGIRISQLPAESARESARRRHRLRPHLATPFVRLVIVDHAIQFCGAGLESLRS